MKTAKLPTDQATWWKNQTKGYEKPVKEILSSFLDPYIQGLNEDPTDEQLRDHYRRLIERYDYGELPDHLAKTASQAYHQDYKELHHNLHYVMETYWKVIREKREKLKSVKR